MVMVGDAVDVVVTGVEAESFIFTSKVYEPDSIVDGVTQDMPKPEDVVFDGVAHCVVTGL